MCVCAAVCCDSARLTLFSCRSLSFFSSLFALSPLLLCVCVCVCLFLQETHDKLVEAVGGISNVHFLAAALLPDEEDAFEEDDSLTVEQTINRQMELYKETYGGRDVQYGEFDEFEMVAPPGGGKGGAAGGGAAGGAAAASAAQPDEVAPLSPLRDGDGDGDDEAEE